MWHIDKTDASANCQLWYHGNWKRKMIQQSITRDCIEGKRRDYHQYEGRELIIKLGRLYNSGRRGMISSRRWYVLSRALRIIDFQNL
jgi:hypothetical protein